MFTLPKLPYAYDALEPYIDRMTMEIHYTKHHQGYVDNLNKALEQYPALQDKTLVDLLSNLNSLPEAVRTAIRNQGGGHFNHTLFWPMMKKNGGGNPKGSLAEAINKQFGSFENFQNSFNTAAKGVFGSGWAWLAMDKQGKLMVTSTHNQDATVSLAQKPILGLDVWEHAYYLKYQNKRPDYISAWWHVIDWDHIEDNFRQAGS
ncbi:MAG TPA: superoxide dismutase [Candidatus Babeliales bacterium]|nr:superoxide dismutase [Candidatus Babeliales bacterium]